VGGDAHPARTSGLLFDAIGSGTKDIPRVLDPAQAEKMPELAVLGVMAHAGNEAPERALEMATVALAGCHGLADDRALYYSELIFASLDKVAKAALEKLMASGHFEFQSDSRANTAARDARRDAPRDAPKP